MLNLGWIDLKKKAVELEQESLLTECSSVWNGYYYYFRKSQRGCYINLFRDKGEKIGKVEWDNKDGAIYGAFVLDQKLYLLHLNRKALVEKEEYKDEITCIDLKTHEVNVIEMDDLSEEIWIMGDYIYSVSSDGRDLWKGFDKTGKRIHGLSYEFTGLENDNDKQVIDGKVYYFYDENKFSQQPKNAPRPFVQVDLAKRERRVLLEYVPNLNRNAVVRLIDMNEKGLYVMEVFSEEIALYQIPFHGGKMKCLFKKETIDWMDDYENDFSLESYYMDYKGKNIKQLTKEVPLDIPSN